MVTRAGLELADHLEPRIDELCEAVLAEQEPIQAEQSRPFLRAWLQGEIEHLRGHAERTHEWVALLSESVRAWGGGIEVMLEQARIFRDATIKACAGKVRGITDAELLGILNEQQDRLLHHIGAYWSQRERECVAAERRRQRAMADLMDRPFVMLDADGAIIMANHPFAHELGAPMESLTGKEFAALCDKETGGQMRRAVRQKRSTQPSAFEGSLVSMKTPRPVFRFTVQPIFDAHGRRDGVLVFMRRAETARSEDREMVAGIAHQLLCMAPVAIQVFDRDRRMLYCNDAAKAVQSDKETVAPACCDLIFSPQDPAMPCPCTQVFAAGQRFHGEGHRVAAGKTLWYQATLNPIEHDGEQVTRIACILRDITGQRSVENQLMRQQQSSLASQLAVTVAHQLRNPLGVMVGFAEMLARGLPPEHVSGAVNKVLRNGLRCKEIVEDLLEFGQGYPGERVAIDFHVLVKEYLQPMIAHCDAASITWQLADQTMMIDCVPAQIAHVFFCLIQNSVQAGAHHILFSAAVEDGRVAVRVHDDGPGVPPELREVIFQPFFSTSKHEGALGLGLSLSQAVVTDYGGHIALENVAAGACLAVWLPMIKDAAPVESAQPIETPSEHRRLLVVDDELDLLEMLEMILQMCGYEVDTTGTAAEALEMINRIDYDAVVLDVRLPGDMSGAQLYEYIAATRPLLAKRAMFITADTMNYETRKFLERVQRPSMEKPFLVYEFAAKVAKLFEDKP